MRIRINKKFESLSKQKDEVGSRRAKKLVEPDPIMSKGIQK